MHGQTRGAIHGRQTITNTRMDRLTEQPRRRQVKTRPNGAVVIKIITVRVHTEGLMEGHSSSLLSGWDAYSVLFCDSANVVDRAEVIQGNGPQA